MLTWTKAHIESQTKHFPEGQIGVIYDDQLVASSCSLIADYDLWPDLCKVHYFEGGKEHEL
ncbi:MAG: hypothetical protein ABIP94_01925 [Planctomycetota bacterium]